MNKDRKKEKTVAALESLLSAADRVSRKFGHDENNVPSDWSEWVELRRCLMEARYALKREGVK